MNVWGSDSEYAREAKQQADRERDAAARWNTRMWACLMLSGIAAAGILGALIGSALVRMGWF